jgi:hypothetical protein
MQPSKPNNSGAMSVEHLHNTAINLVEAVCSVLAMPVETLLRPWYGTRYYPPPVVFFASALMILIPAIAALFSGIVGMIPFSHPAPSIGLFDIGSLAKLYFLLAIVHAVRLYRRMITMSKEQCSTFEGPPLPFFQLVPWCRSFWVTRVAAEPLFVIVVASVLQDLFLIQSGLATYLRLAALALAMKQFISWFKAWEYLRDLLDARNAGPILARLIEDEASEEELATIHLASFPKDVPEEIRSQAAISIARAYSPDR